MAGIQPEEFTQFVEQYKNLVYTICFSFCRNVFDAEDLTQETFLSAYRARESFDGAHEKAWLTAIAANKCRDYLKRPKQKRETLSPETLELLEDPAYRPEETFLAETENGRVTRLIQSLKEPYRTTASQYFLEDKRLSDVAKHTGQKLKTLQTQLYRAKKLLADLWKEEQRHENPV